MANEKKLFLLDAYALVLKSSMVSIITPSISLDKILGNANELLHDVSLRKEFAPEGWHVPSKNSSRLSVDGLAGQDGLEIYCFNNPKTEQFLL